MPGWITLRRTLHIEVTTLTRALRYALIGLLLVAVLIFSLGWWTVHRALPQLDGTLVLPDLKQEVTVDRDAWGVPHIRAGSLEDLVAAQGYVVAQDRLWQMDLLRRVAAGELSEIFGPQTLPLDREYRTLGLRVVAEREAASLDEEARMLLEAYARGVNRYIAERRGKLPWEFAALGYTPRPWRPADSLLIGGYMYQTLTNTWQRELKRARVLSLVGPERAADLFPAESPYDHYIVGGTPPPAPPRRAKPKAPRAEEESGEPELWREAQALLEHFDAEVREEMGSNNFVVDGTHTASRKPLLANETHLQLSVPCIWYMAHLTAPGWNVKGFTLPGAPLVIIGHNDRIAWGFTNNYADVQDLYLETFNPTNPREYAVNGKWARAEIRTERIHVKGQPDEVLDVPVTRHGPIVFRQGGRSYALKWTALEPGGLGLGHGLLGHAQNWQEFREAMRHVTGPAQNAVYADVAGNIGFMVAARIPIRKNGNGAMPTHGDGDDYEWIGYIPFDELPQVLNPPGGVIATANARVVGPGYRHYLTDRWASPWRTERVYQLLAEKRNLSPEDCIAIQADIVSLPHRLLAEHMVRASQAVKPKKSQAQELLSQLAKWDGRATADSAETAFAEYTRRALMTNLLRPYLGHEIELYDWMADTIFLEKVLRDRPANWLPPNFSSYDELLMESADEAIHLLTADTKSADRSHWRWGRINALRMDHPLGRAGWGRPLLSIGPLDQPGTLFTVRAARPSFGPAMRFVADPSDWDRSLMNITMGQSGQYGSPHYRDQFTRWFDGRSIPAPFSDAAEAKIRAHTLRLQPASPR